MICIGPTHHHLCYLSSWLVNFRYQFTHALIQETLVEELSLTRRVKLHTRIAEMLEELYADDIESHATELAHHFTQVEASLCRGKSVGKLRLEDAEVHNERALAAKEDQPVDSELADILFGQPRISGAKWAHTPQSRPFLQCAVTSGQRQIR